MTILCPQCHQDHGLYWVRWADNTKHLTFRCNSVPVLLNQNNPHKTPRLGHRSQQFPVTDEAVILQAKKLKKLVPEVWNKKCARKHQDQQQMKLI